MPEISIYAYRGFNVPATEENLEAMTHAIGDSRDIEEFKEAISFEELTVPGVLITDQGNFSESNADHYLFVIEYSYLSGEDMYDSGIHSFNEVGNIESLEKLAQKFDNSGVKMSDIGYYHAVNIF